MLLLLVDSIINIDQISERTENYNIKIILVKYVHQSITSHNLCRLLFDSPYDSEIYSVSQSSEPVKQISELTELGFPNMDSLYMIEWLT